MCPFSGLGSAAALPGFAPLPPKTSEIPMTTLEEVRARFARSQGLPFADVLDRGQHPATSSTNTASSTATGCSAPSPPSGASSARCSATTTAAATPSSRIIAHRAASGLEPCSPNTASYCNARGTPAHRRAAHPGQADRPAVAGRRCPRRGSGTGGTSSSPTAPTSPCPTPRRTRRPTRSRWCSSRASASRWPGSPCCCRWRPAPATTWPSRRTRARAPARPRCCGRCTTRCRPATWSSPTPCSTTTSSPASCASAASSWSPACRRSAWAAGRWRAGPTATSSSGSGPTSRTA